MKKQYDFSKGKRGAVIRFRAASRASRSGWMTTFWIGSESRSMMRAVEVIRT